MREYAIIARECKRKSNTKSARKYVRVLTQKPNRNMRQQHATEIRNMQKEQTEQKEQKTQNTKATIMCDKKEKIEKMEYFQKMKLL